MVKLDWQMVGIQPFPANANDGTLVVVRENPKGFKTVEDWRMRRCMKKLCKPLDEEVTGEKQKSG